MSKPVPEGYHSVTPYLVLNDAAGAIEFYKTAFGASELMRMAAPGGRIGHASQDRRLAHHAGRRVSRDGRAQRQDDRRLASTHLPLRRGGGRRDRQGLAAGAKGLRPLKDQFYGDRSGSIEDPFGHVWHVSTHKEDVPPDELKRRAEGQAMRWSGR